MKNDKQVVTPVKKPKAKLKAETKCFDCKENCQWKWNCPRYLADKKDWKVIHLGHYRPPPSSPTSSSWPQ